MPYKGVRYHLKEQAIAACHPRNAKEFFNLRYSSLCNIIEQIFGVLKKRFPILKVAAEFLLQSQVEIVSAFTTLHNFIRIHSGEEEDIFEQADPAGTNRSGIQEPQATARTKAIAMNIKRDAMVEHI